MKKFIINTSVVLLFLVSACGGGFKKSPLDVLVRDLTDVQNFTIMLYDMDVEGTFAKTYLHQYRIISEKGDEFDEKTTEWYEVSEDFFMLHQNNLGMEIASKKDGKLNKTVSPPGYSNYVGNKKYGQWVKRSDGTSFWEFYGKYAMISSMFRMMSPVPYGYYNDYHSNYYRYGRPYYGPRTNGRYSYGTGSSYNSRTKTSSRWSTNKSNNSFKQKVNSRVSQSKSRTSSGKSSRSGSRYSSGGSSFRSRSGGFGK